MVPHVISIFHGLDIRAVVDHAERAVILPWFWWWRQGWAVPRWACLPPQVAGHGPTRIELRSAEHCLLTLKSRQKIRARLGGCRRLRTERRDPSSLGHAT